ncbi:Ig-like domain-containing protein [Rhodopseudomonas sp. B29]|uniref:Ig-like domain-containing protein n=1 Tax=Rhodopseudomonas sp. B29 TaxID=95607 RepID=UPI0004CF669D|nr:Ig-like domain-containing protein [Rhodopseudomonas sp. B29]
MRWSYVLDAVAALLVTVLFAILLASAPATAQTEFLTETTTTNLTVTRDPAVTGRITLTAVIASDFGGAVAEGRVAFHDLSDGRVLGWTNATQPTLTVDGLTPGRHLIRADYSGVSSLLPMVVLPSQSPEMAVDVLARPLVTLTTEGGAVAPGELVTLVVNVRGSSGMPGGAVTFRDGDRVIAAHVPLNSVGSAAFTTSALPEGVRTLVAAYEGDEHYAPAEATVEQIVSDALVMAAQPRM